MRRLLKLVVLLFVAAAPLHWDPCAQMVVISQTPPASGCDDTATGGAGTANENFAGRCQVSRFDLSCTGSVTSLALEIKDCDAFHETCNYVIFNDNGSTHPGTLACQSGAINIGPAGGSAGEIAFSSWSCSTTTNIVWAGMCHNTGADTTLWRASSGGTHYRSGSLTSNCPPGPGEYCWYDMSNGWSSSGESTGTKNHNATIVLGGG